MSIEKLSCQQEAYDRYEFAGLLGEGTMGMVYAGIQKSTNERVAIKTMTFTKSDYEEVVKEIGLLFSLRSKYVVSIVDAVQFDNQLWIVMECCEGGAINDIMRAIRSPLNEPQAKEVVAYMLLALLHCHNNQIIHRDIKAANVLLHHNGTAKLADFGLSAELSPAKQKRNTVVGTSHFMSPEMIKGQSYDGGVDVWSLGITLYELCEGEPPYFNKNATKAHVLIASRASPKLKNPSAWSDECNDFLRLCLERDVAKRPSVSKLLEHAWVRASVVDIEKNDADSSSALKDFFDANIDAILALRHQDDSSDESDNECDFDALAELEEARRRAEQEAAANLEAQQQAEEAARLQAEQEADRLRAEQEAVQQELERLKVADDAALRLKAEQGAAELAAEETASRQEISRLKTEQEAARQKANHLATEKAMHLDGAQMSAASEREQEAIANAARMKAVQQAVEDGVRMKDANTNVEEVPCRPACHAMLARKRNKGSFKLSDWKAAFFVLDEGVLKYFRSEADYRHNQDPGKSGALKKERCFQLSVHSKAQNLPASKFSVEVFDNIKKWNVAIKCKDEATCRSWLNNVDAHVKYLEYEDDQERAQQRAGQEKHDEDGEEEDDEFDVPRRKMDAVVTTSVTVNKFINKLRVSAKEQDRTAMRRLSKQLMADDHSNSNKLLPCELRGWVHKRTDHAHHWKKRFVVMEECVLKFFLTDKNRDPHAVFVLSHASTVQREGDILKIEHMHGTEDDGKTTLSATALAIKLDDGEETWALQTWLLAIQDNIAHSENIQLPENLKHLSSDTDVEK